MHPPCRSLLKHTAYLTKWLLYHSWSSITLCRFIWRNPSLSDLLGMLGPPKFDESKGDRRTDPSLQLSLVPRERTHESPGVASSSGPARLTPGPCATLPTSLIEDPLVARIVPSRYNGHVIVYTDNKVMTVQERNALVSTSLPDLELQPGSPSGFISVKLPRTNIDHQDLLVQRRVAIKQGGALTLGGAYLWDLALLLEGLSAENENTCQLGYSLLCCCLDE